MSRLPILSHAPSTSTRGVVLVDMPWTRDKDPRVPLGHASLAASLLGAGIPVAPVVAPVNSDQFSVADVRQRVLDAARLLGPSVVIAIGAYVWCEPFVQELLPALATALPSARIVVGGPQVSFADDVRGLYSDATCVVRGAGEGAIVALAGAAFGAPIPGVVWTGLPDTGGQARVDLDSLPSPFLTGVVPVRPGGFVRWETQRGCPHKCSFCQHRNRDAVAVQRLPEGRIHEEIALFAQAGVADIAILDPIFNAGKRSERILESCRSQGLTARLSVQARLESTDQRFLDAARGLDLRLEFGLQTVHEAEGAAIQRSNRMDRAERNLGLVRDSGHPFEVSLIYGLPNQTLASFRESVAWCLERGVPTIKAFPLMLLRGTELDRQRDEWGLVEDGAVIPQVIASSSFGPGEHAQMADLAEALRRTEGRHLPLGQLLSMAEGLVPEVARFSPVAA